MPEGAGPERKPGSAGSRLEAVPRTAAHHTEKLVSIVILGFNQVEYTKKCIESIRHHTRQKYELILVDNGSKDGTEAFFRSIPGAKVIRNPENLGVSKGWNQGMRLAAGEYILILNNDIIVGPDWLENMVRLAESDPSIGLVGPRSNYIAGPQVVPEVPYRQEAEILPFIRKWQEEHALSAAEFGFIKGFCHLIPRSVFEKVGFYDERFGKGNFEDDDYCVRVRYNGFRALFANDSFIHHYGSVSFNQESVDWRALMIENQKKYEQKWAKGAAAVNDTQVDVPVADTATATAPPPRLRPPRQAGLGQTRGRPPGLRKGRDGARARPVPGSPDSWTPPIPNPIAAWASSPSPPVPFPRRYPCSWDASTWIRPTRTRPATCWIPSPPVTAAFPSPKPPPCAPAIPPTACSKRPPPKPPPRTMPIRKPPMPPKR